MNQILNEPNRPGLWWCDAILKTGPRTYRFCLFVDNSYYYGTMFSDEPATKYDKPLPGLYRRMNKPIWLESGHLSDQVEIKRLEAENALLLSQMQRIKPHDPAQTQGPVTEEYYGQCCTVNESVWRLD